MPIIQEGNVKTLRIKNGTVEIWRVYRGNELVWGLYKLIYHLAGGKQSENPPTEYVWGVTDIELPTPTWLNQTYYTKFNGWYEGDTYVKAIPAITKDLHKDLELYAKWTQRKYTYSGTYVYQVWVEDGGGGDFSPITDTTPRLGVYSGECTEWCVYRSNQAFSQACVTSYGNAGTWMEDRSAGRGCTPGKDWVKSTGSPVPGDIAILSDGGAGHVLFVETSSIITQANVWNPGGGWIDLWRNIGYDTFHSRGYQYFSCVAVSSYHGYLGCKYEGCLHYTKNSGGGGGGHYENRYGSVSERDNPSQKPPTDPAPPQGRWSSLNKLTKTRDYDYKTNNWGPWNSGSSGWDTSGEGWL